jgi:hypothetical protein
MCEFDVFAVNDVFRDDTYFMDTFPGFGTFVP